MRFAFIMVGFFALGGAAIFWNSMNSNTHSMTQPNTSKIAEGDPIVIVELPEAMSAAALQGEKYFEVKCSVCHGVNAAGKNGIAPPLIHKIYEPSHHGDEAFYRAAQLGVQSHHWNFGNMPKITGITRADIKPIIAYIREVQQANGIN